MLSNSSIIQFVFSFSLKTGKVKEKVYGKQKVYAIDQDLVSSPDALNITQMDAKISELTRQNAEDEAFIKKAETELKILNCTISIAKATSQLKTVFELSCHLCLSFYKNLINSFMFYSSVKKMKQWN